MKRILAVLFGVISLLLLCTSVWSFEPETHVELSRNAVLISSLDQFLRSDFGFPGGIGEVISNKEISAWIEFGAQREDDFPRFLSHFHNPLKTWDKAGLLNSTLGPSSIRWGQNRFQMYSWQDARESYFAALTAINKDFRAKDFAFTFRTVGHLIHLVQDAGNPAHTRNDPHPFAKGLEGFVEKLRTSILPTDQTLYRKLLNGTPVHFDSSILGSTPNVLAPIPLARIIDTTDPEQAAALPSAGAKQGIAEYSNANFLSFDTVFKDFTHPGLVSLGTPFDEANSPSERVRTYAPKVNNGEKIVHFAAHGAFFRYLAAIGREDLGYILDPRVFQDYAEKLLPRAIGYSAGLIDYFFRGRLDVSVVESDAPEGSDASSLRINVSNATSAGDWPGNSETEEGSLVAVLMSGDKVLGVTGPSEAGNKGKYEVTRAPQEFTFNFGSGQGSGENSDLSVLLVYRGPLGREEDAVAVGRAPLSPLSVDPLSGTLSCPDGTVTFTASGGLPPYTWSATQGTLLVDEDGRTAHLKTENSGNVSGNAYRVIGDAVRTVFPFQCQARQSRCMITYTCDDSVALRQESGGAGETHYICQSPDSSTGCGFENCGESLCDFVEGNPSSAYFEDLRSPEMIDSGCAPCTLVAKEGVIVTIKDSSGAEITAAVAGGTASSATASGP